MLLDLRLTPPDLSLADNALAHRETKQLEGGSGGQSAARKGPRIPDPRGSSEGGRGGAGGALCSPKPLPLFSLPNGLPWSWRRSLRSRAGVAARPLHAQGAEPGWEGAFVAQPVAPRLPRPPPGSQGGDELRQLRLRLLPLLSLGEGPGQGRAIVLPGSCGAPGLRSRPSGGHVPNLLCLALPRFGLVHREELRWGMRRQPRATSSGSRARLPAPRSQPGSAGRDKGMSRSWGSCSSAGWERGPLRSIGKAWRAPRAGHLLASLQPRGAPFLLATLPARLHLLPGRKLVSSGSPMTPGAGALGSMCGFQYG